MWQRRHGQIRGGAGDGLEVDLEKRELFGVAVRAGRVGRHVELERKIEGRIKFSGVGFHMFVALEEGRRGQYGSQL